MSTATPAPDPATLQHAARALAAAGDHTGATLLTGLLADAYPVPQPPEPPPVPEPQGEQASAPKRAQKSRRRPRPILPGTVGTDDAAYARLRAAFFLHWDRWAPKASSDIEADKLADVRWGLYRSLLGAPHFRGQAQSCGCGDLDAAQPR